MTVALNDQAASPCPGLRSATATAQHQHQHRRPEESPRPCPLRHKSSLEVPIDLVKLPESYISSRPGFFRPRTTASSPRRRHGPRWPLRPRPAPPARPKRAKNSSGRADLRPRVARARARARGRPSRRCISAGAGASRRPRRMASSALPPGSRADRQGPQARSPGRRAGPSKNRTARARVWPQTRRRARRRAPRGPPPRAARSCGPARSGCCRPGGTASRRAGRGAGA